MEIEPIKIKTPKVERMIGSGHPCFIIAEMSANHNQDYDKAVDIIKMAAASGADAIKLQTYTPDTITMDSDNKYFVIGDQIGSEDNPESWKGNTIYNLYQKAYTPWEWHADLKKVAEDLGLVFFSTPYDFTAVDFLKELDVPLYKIASYEVTHIPLIKRVAQTGKPVIMSVGFASIEDIELALDTLRKNGTNDILLLHCTTAYSGEPKPENTNLRTMLDMKERFGVQIGFSDNNAGIEIPLQAAMLGASVIEKHVVADKNDDTYDSDFSVGPDEFKNFVDAVRQAEVSLGEVKYGIKCEAEKNNSKYQQSIFVVKNMKSGEEFTEDNIRVIRPFLGLHSKHYEEVLGQTASKDIEQGTPLNWNLLKKN